MILYPSNIYILGQIQESPTGLQTIRMSNFFDPGDNVSMNYPSTWSVNETDLTPEDRVDLIVEFVSPFETFNDTYTEYVQINRDDGIFYEADLDEYLDEAINAYRESTNNFTIIKSSTSDFLLGLPAYSLIYTQLLDDENGEEPITLKNFETGILVNNTAYFVTYIGQEDQFNNYFPIVKQMINSVKLKLPSDTGLNTPTYLLQPNQLIDQIAKKLYDANPSINIDEIKKVLEDSASITQSKGGNVVKVLDNILQLVTSDSNGPVASNIIKRASNNNTNIVPSLPS